MFAIPLLLIVVIAVVWGLKQKRIARRATREKKDLEHRYAAILGQLAFQSWSTEEANNDNSVSDRHVH